MKKYTLPATILFFILFLGSCAPEGMSVKEYGFLYGLLHGFILPFAIVGKLFGMDHGLYAVTNTGFLYWLGYLLGFIIITGGGGRAGRRKRRD